MALGLFFSIIKRISREREREREREKERERERERESQMVDAIYAPAQLFHRNVIDT